MNMNMSSFESVVPAKKSPDRQTQAMGSFAQPDRAVERAPATPEEKAKLALAQANSFDKVRAALEGIEGIIGSKGFIPKSTLLHELEIIERVANDTSVPPTAPFAFITNGLKFRDALIRSFDTARTQALAAQIRKAPPIPPTRIEMPAIDPRTFAPPIPATRIEMPAIDPRTIVENKNLPPKERMEAAQTFTDVEKILADVQGITGGRWYSPFEVQQQITEVQTAIRTNKIGLLPALLGAVTSGDGLREAAKRAARNALEGRW